MFVVEVDCGVIVFNPQDNRLKAEMPFIVEKKERHFRRERNFQELLYRNRPPLDLRSGMDREKGEKQVFFGGRGESERKMIQEGYIKERGRVGKR